MIARPLCNTVALAGSGYTGRYVAPVTRTPATSDALAQARLVLSARPSASAVPFATVLAAARDALAVRGVA